MDRGGPRDHFESVVLGRIVASGDHHSAIRLQMKHRVVEHGGGHDADVGYVAAARLEPGHQGIPQPLRAETAIAAEVDILSVMTLQICADGAAEILNAGILQLGFGFWGSKALLSAG